MDVGFLANLAIAQIKLGMKIDTVLSLSGVAKQPNKVNMQQGFSLDLREIDPESGKPWDVSDPNIRAKDEQKVREENARGHQFESD